MATAEIPETATARPNPVIRVIHRANDGQAVMDFPIERVGEALHDSGATLWIDIQSPEADPSAVEALFHDVFAFHPLAIEDALRETHVPKVDDWGRYLYVVFQAIRFDPAACEPTLSELDIFLGSNYLVTCHSGAMECLDCVRLRVGRDPDRLSRGPDHVLYHILDEGVAAYLSAIEALDEAIDSAQEEVFDRPSPETLQRIFQIKRAALRLHRMISPTREVLNRLARDAYPQIDAPDRVYFRDVYDHLVRIHDITEGLRDLISGALDTYLSAISNRTNEIMKTLTLVTVLFLPMSFLAGFFGMNFFGENLVLRSGLPSWVLFWGTCLLMFGTPVALWTWARRRGWF